MNQEKVSRKQTKNTLLWMLRVSEGKRWNILFLLVVELLLGGSGVLYALLMRGLIDCATARDASGALHYGTVFVSLVVGQLILRAIGRFLNERSYSSLENCFKKHLFSCLLRGDYAAVSAQHSGEWMKRLTSDTAVVASGMTQILPSLGGMLIKLVGALIVLISLEPRLAKILIPLGFALILVTYSFRKVLKKMHKTIQESDGRLRVFLQERLSAMMIVRTFSREKVTLESADEYMEDYRAARMRRNHFSNFCNIGFGTIMRGAYVGGVIYGAVGIFRGTLTYGTMTAILQLIGQVQSPFANISGYIPRFYAMTASAERLMEADALCREESLPDHTESEISSFYHSGFRAIALRDLCFTYSAPVGDDPEVRMPRVLSHLNITIQKGHYVALTGPSGCGKSTLLKLLLGLYAPEGGQRLLLTDSGQIPLDISWRGLFAYVPQGNQLLSGTVRQVLTFGDKEKMQQDEKLWQALTIACADDFVSALDRGLDSPLGERGAGLSEGQMQRLAIARAIFSDRPILLLDEATASLDSDTETQLLKNLRAMTDKTVIIVTHRPAALSISDEVIPFTQDDE